MRVAAASEKRGYILLYKLGEFMLRRKTRAAGLYSTNVPGINFASHGVADMNISGIDTRATIKILYKPSAGERERQRERERERVEEEAPWGRMGNFSNFLPRVEQIVSGIYNTNFDRAY